MSSLSRYTRSILSPPEAQRVTVTMIVCLQKHGISSFCNIPHLFTSRWNMAGTITFWVPHFHVNDFVMEYGSIGSNYDFIAFAKTTFLTFVSGIGKQLYLGKLIK